jgi:hypothetical protein
MQIKWVNLTKVRGVHSSGIWCCITGYWVPDTSGWEEFSSDIATDKFQVSVFLVNVRFRSPTSMASYPSRTESRTIMYVLILHVLFKCNQQDASLYNILYYCQCSACFRRFLRPSSGAQKLYAQQRVYVKLACCYRWFVCTVGCVYTSNNTHKPVPTHPH